ncbi:hypothetical protein [Algoriphagus sp. SE2]|uniref:hypothetical protein n=1 Tax=Algoriphagus sp. SE2 TaxID=3141536 RepID=UPI0031E19425
MNRYFSPDFGIGLTMVVGTTHALSVRRFIALQYQNPMDMVGHNHKFAQFDVFCMGFYFMPKDRSNRSRWCQLCFIFDDFSEKMLSVFTAYCDKIGSLSSIIPTCQTG